MFKFSEELHGAIKSIDGFGYDTLDQDTMKMTLYSMAQSNISIAKSLEVIAEKGIHLPQLNGFEVETIPDVQGITKVRVRTGEKK